MVEVRKVSGDLPVLWKVSASKCNALKLIDEKMEGREI